MDVFLARLACGKPSGVEISAIGEGSEFSLGGKDIQIDHSIQASAYFAGTCFANGVVLNTSESASSSVLRNSSTAVKQFTPLKPRSGLAFKGPSLVRPSNASSTSSVTARSPRTQKDVGTDIANVVDAGKSTYWMVNWSASSFISSAYNH